MTNPGDAGPIVRRPMGLPITAGCDTAWILKEDVDSLPDCLGYK
jgi:hypothetical protein